MAGDRTGEIARFIRRVLHWLACLIGRKKATAQTESARSEGAAQPEATADVIAHVSIPPQPPLTGAKQTCERGGAAAHEFQEKAVEACGEVEAGTLDKTTGTWRQDRAEDQRDTSGQPEIEPSGESGSPPHPSPPLPTHPRSDKRQETLDETPPAPDRSDLVVPDTHTPEKVESERGRDDGPNRPEEEAEDKERSVVPPEERGGRPRRGSADKEQGKPRRRLPTTPRPEIVCWKAGREWVVGVELPDGISGSSNILVLQAGAKLAKDGSRAGCWRLSTLNAPVEVRAIDSGDHWTLDIPVALLLFKLSGSRLDHGRKVKQASSGLYLAIVPNTWHRDEKKAGSAPTTPEPVFLDGYLAHFFELTAGAPSCVAFRDDQGKPTIIGAGGPQFRLAGQEIQDASEGIGPLFGGLPPRICIENGQWSDVGTIVVGQEGGGRQRWRKGFEPKADQAEQELPHEILERKAGWYFMRFYDLTDTLIDSLDFRFVAGLKEISIPTAGPVPFPNGHVAQTVEVHRDASYTVVQAGQKYPGLKMEQDTDKTIVTIPPTAACDRTRWYIHPANSHRKEVEFTILIERLWWALSSDDKEPSQWEDRPVPLSPEHFGAKSDRAIWLRFPKARWVSVVAAGFRRDGSRNFPVKVTDRAVPIPLREFAGVQELDDGAVEHKFKVWLKIGQITHEVTIAVLPMQEGDGGIDLASIPAHRLATVLTDLRRAARGPARRPIKNVRSKYRRAPRARPERNVEFVKEALCLIAILSERAGREQLFSLRLSENLKRSARLARRKFPDIAQGLEKALSGVNR
jgi:hypothetical protein